jgi:hypothetical protein
MANQAGDPGSVGPWPERAPAGTPAPPDRGGFAGTGLGGDPSNPSGWGSTGGGSGALPAIAGGLVAGPAGAAIGAVAPH